MKNIKIGDRLFYFHDYSKTFQEYTVDYISDKTVYLKCNNNDSNHSHEFVEDYFGKTKKETIEKLIKRLEERIEADSKEIAESNRILTEIGNQ